MENWGEADTARYLRLVYANEPLERLQCIAARFARAFALEAAASGARLSCAVAAQRRLITQETRR